MLYTLGGLENLQAAKKYYSSTVDLTGGKNTRALFGICLVSSSPLSCNFIIWLFLICMTEWMVWSLLSSAHLPSHNSQKGETRKIVQTCNHLQQQPWRKTTSKELLTRFLCLLQLWKVWKCRHDFFRTESSLTQMPGSSS